MTEPDAARALGRASASRLLFARMDDGAGGALQTLKRRLKFQWRYWWHKEHLQGVSVQIDQLGLRPYLVRDPELLVRCMRPYLWSGLPGAARAEALKQHLNWLAATLPPLALAGLYQQGPRMLHQWTCGEDQLCLALQPGRALGREGELELHLLLNGVSAVRASFSVLPGRLVGHAATGSILVVGNLQGAANGRDLIRQLAGAIDKVRPSHLLLNALQGLAQGWGLTGVAGVSSRGHVYASYGSLRKRVGISYDGLWQELGATEQLSPTHWAVPLAWHEKSLEEVASKKRSEVRRRNVLRQQTLDACRAAARQLSPASLS